MNNMDDTMNYISNIYTINGIYWLHSYGFI